MIGINVNPKRDFINARYGQFASTSINETISKRSPKTSSSFRKSNSNFRHETSNDDFMSKLKDSSSSGNVYIPSNGVESIDINNYVENLLM